MFAKIKNNKLYITFSWKPECSLFCANCFYFLKQLTCIRISHRSHRLTESRLGGTAAVMPLSRPPPAGILHTGRWLAFVPLRPSQYLGFY